MKVYRKPQIEITEFAAEDIITDSGLSPANSSNDNFNKTDDGINNVFEI